MSAVGSTAGGSAAVGAGDRRDGVDGALLRHDLPRRDQRGAGKCPLWRGEDLHEQARTLVVTPRVRESWLPPGAAALTAGSGSAGRWYPRAERSLRNPPPEAPL